MTKVDVPGVAPVFEAIDAIATLDVANAGDANIDFGGLLQFGWGVDEDDPITNWRFNTGELSGGTYDIVTTPEPATLVLVVIGAVAGLRRRRVA